MVYRKYVYEFQHLFVISFPYLFIHVEFNQPQCDHTYLASYETRPFEYKQICISLTDNGKRNYLQIGLLYISEALCKNFQYSMHQRVHH